MSTLFQFELKKVFCRRSYIIAMLIMICILVSNEVTPIILGNYKPKKESEKALSGTVVDDEYLSCLQAKEEHNTTNPVEFFIKAATGQSEITGHTQESLYRARREINESMMRSNGLSDKSIEVWKMWDSRNEEPFTYLYSGSYTAFLEMTSYLNFMILIVTGIGLSGIFADEKSTNMDQLIFCTKHGRTKLFGIKLAAGMLLGFVSTFILLLVELILCLILYGPGGAEMMIQVLIPQCMMHLSMGQAVAFMILILFFEEFILVSIVLLVSQLTMNKAVTTASMFVLMFCGMLNLVPERMGILYILWNAIPGATAGSWLFTDYHLISVFGLHLNVLVYTPLLWVIAGIALLLLTKVLYGKYQVKSR